MINTNNTSCYKNFYEGLLVVYVYIWSVLGYTTVSTKEVDSFIITD